MTDFTQPATCRYCHALVDPADNFCRSCGRGLKSGYGFFYSHTGIILLAFVLGPLVLPFVWLSKQMGLTAKIIYSIVFCIMGFYLFLTCYHLYQFAAMATQGLLGVSF